MKYTSLLYAICCCFVATYSQAQTRIAFQSFERAATDTWGLTFSTPPCNSGGGEVWDYSTGLNGLLPSEGATFWAVQDLTGTCGNSNGETLIFANTSVTGFTNVSIKFDYDIVGFDNGDNVFYTVILDGVAQTQVQLVNGGGGFSTGGYVTETITIPNGTSSVGLRVLVDQNGRNDRAAFDNFILEGTGSVSACTQTVTAYAPTSGPVGTEVRITGTGFTNSSTVTFNNVSASNVQFVSATELVATAPATVSSGNIVVTEASCAVTAGGFTVIKGATSCSAPLSGLIISEVYDNNGGSLGYIELYNGTATSIDLTLYGINRYSDLGASSPSYTYTFPTTGTGSSIAPGQVLVGKVSNSFGNAGNFNFTGSTNGFNDNDRLELVLTATNTVVDVFQDDVVGAKGYVYRRKTTITGPNPTHTTSEWTTASSGDISDLGKYSITATSSPPTITSQPTDVSGCNVNIGVTATASNGGTLSYQWFFNPNDGTTTGWSAVTAASFTGAVLNGATTSNLQITGNLTAFNNYQFYCKITEGGNCDNISEAVQFNLASERFFRSATTGNWTLPATWETASSAAGPWSAACIYPTASNSDYIHVLATHKVTVNANLLVDQLEIEVGGEVIIQNNRLLELANGPGVDIQINGTLTDNGNGSNGINFSNNGGTWAYGANGTIIKTGSSSAVQYRNNYQGGIANVPSTANWHYRYTGNSSSVAVTTINMFYPNLYFESTNGSHSFSRLAETLKGASGYATVKGNFFVGATGTGTVEVFNINTNATLMKVLGNMTIGGNGVSGRSTLNNNKGSKIGTGIEVFGYLLINSNGQLDFSDGTSTLDGRFRLHGNWTNNNTGNGFTEGQSTVEFVGNGTQTVNKATTGENFHNIVVDKPSGFLQNNVKDMIIENDALFTRGIVRTTAATYMVFRADATATNASDRSHVDGPVVKETHTGTQTTFTYPTGDNNIYGPIGIATRFHRGQPFVAHYHNTGYGTYTRNSLELDHVSRLEYWDLDEHNGSLGENLRLTLHWGPHSDVITPNSLRVAHFFTQAPSTTNQWEREGNHPVITGNATRGSVRSDYVTSFSPFTLGDITLQASLPLDLLRFEVTKVEQTTDIVWEVANEHAGDTYCLQRSNDAQNFEKIACFEASQNENLAQYRYIDENPLFGYNYYRIHQIDYAGTSDYSPTKVVKFDGVSKVKIYPNPAKNTLQLVLPRVGADYTIRVVDALGRNLINTTRKGDERHQQLDISKLAAGTYILQVETTTGIADHQKITIVK